MSTTAPTISCPYCDREFHVDDYFDLDVGDEVDCIHCRKTIRCQTVEHLIEWRWIKTDDENVCTCASWPVRYHAKFCPKYTPESEERR